MSVWPDLLDVLYWLVHLRLLLLLRHALLLERLRRCELRLDCLLPLSLLHHSRLLGGKKCWLSLLLLRLLGIDVKLPIR